MRFLLPAAFVLLTLPALIKGLTSKDPDSNGIVELVLIGDVICAAYVVSHW